MEIRTKFHNKRVHIDTHPVLSNVYTTRVHIDPFHAIKTIIIHLSFLTGFIAVQILIVHVSESKCVSTKNECTPVNLTRVIVYKMSIRVSDRTRVLVYNTTLYTCLY